MIFAPHIMAKLPVKNLKVKFHFGSSPDNGLPFFHFKGKLSEILPLLRETADNPKVAGADNCGGSTGYWCGLKHGETFKGMLETVRCQSALEAFMKEESRIKAPLTRDRPKLSVIGSSFSMGRVMQGHPVQCFRRPKHKLPPRKIDLSISVSAGADADKVSASIARIVHAAHDYHLAGGAVSLTVHYLLGFYKPNKETKAEGICFSLEIPLGDGNLAAFSGSVQFFRAILIPFAVALSGKEHDSLKVYNFADQSIANISGYVTDAEKQLASLKVE
jgi:hypothetical protein